MTRRCVWGHKKELVLHNGKLQCRECRRIRDRVRSGWSREEAISVGVIPHGRKTRRREFTGGRGKARVRSHTR